MNHPIPRSADPDDYTDRALAAMLDALDWERDFADWLVRLIATTATIGPRSLTAGRPGSWESDKVADIVQSAGVHESYAQEAYGRDDPRTQP